MSNVDGLETHELRTVVELIVADFKKVKEYTELEFVQFFRDVSETLEEYDLVSEEAEDD